MSIKKEESLDGAVPLRLSNDEPLPDYPRRSFVVTGKSVASTEPSSWPVDPIEPTSDYRAHVGDVPADSDASRTTDSDSTSVVLQVVKHGLALLHRTDRPLTAADRALLTHAVALLAHLQHELENRLTETAASAKSTKKRPARPRKKKDARKRT